MFEVFADASSVAKTFCSEFGTDKFQHQCIHKLAASFVCMGSKYNFGPFELDLAGRKLYKNGAQIEIQQKPFELLSCLVERYPNVVTRTELAQRIWPDTHVSIQQNLNTAVRKVRIALGDSVLDPQFIETVGRRGYRFLHAPSPHSPGGPNDSSDDVREPGSGQTFPPDD